MLRKTFEPKKDKIIECKRLHNKEFYDLYSASNIIQVNKTRRMRWQGLEHIWEAGRPEEKRPL
jgi:hypothetical protein